MYLRNSVGKAIHSLY